MNRRQWSYVIILGLLGYYFSSYFDFVGLQYVSAGLERAALDRLLNYPFPGNVRELAHILESAVALSTENPQIITERDLNPLLRAQPAPTGLPTGLAADCSLESLEKFAIRQALRIAGHNKSRAAELLVLSRGALYRKLKEYGLESEADEIAPNPLIS
jgi:transcriptional regulator with PAS, ATPase and Fis domain